MNAPTIKGPVSGPCCATDCCQSGCDDCPYDYKNTVDPSIPLELLIGTIIDEQEDN